MHRDAQGINSNTQMSKVLETIEKRHVTIFISRCPATPNYFTLDWCSWTATDEYCYVTLLYSLV
jgi:hypothetical protein